MGTLIVPGQPLQAGQEQGQLNQYYGFADASSNTFTSATQGNLCSAYTIPAGEAGYAGAAYEMSCAGFGAWGSTQQALTFQMLLGATLVGTAFGSSPTIAAAALSASSAFNWSLTMKLTCADGISAWWGDLLGAVVSGGATLNPGTASTNAIPIAAVNSGVHTAAVSSALTAVIQAKWASATGAPTITTTKTTWRKTA